MLTRIILASVELTQAVVQYIHTQATTLRALRYLFHLYNLLCVGHIAEPTASHPKLPRRLALFGVPHHKLAVQFLTGLAGFVVCYDFTVVPPDTTCIRGGSTYMPTTCFVPTILNHVLPYLSYLPYYLIIHH
jgi:hypothetical protein